MSHERHGAKQPNRFDPARAAILDDPARFAYVEPDELLALLAIPRAGTLVDFGTGTGLYALEIARRRPDVRVLALDEQPPMLAHVREAIARSGLGNVEAVASDALDTLAGSADRILALNVLHELGDLALGEVRSLLAAGGTAVFVDWNADVERPVGPPRDHVYGVDDAAARLAGAGFRIVSRTAFAYHHAFVVTPVRSED
ncbi:MAG: class I SAM-dependent methyltransferase [Candidatus Eremiobacteraeota bacterium]|nr:class I SAM-dependent methyltransferase [Candidatus Eremiobacteraeota bacterium]